MSNRDAPSFLLGTSSLLGPCLPYPNSCTRVTFPLTTPKQGPWLGLDKKSEWKCAMSLQGQGDTTTGSPSSLVYSGAEDSRMEPVQQIGGTAVPLELGDALSELL